RSHPRPRRRRPRALPDLGRHRVRRGCQRGLVRRAAGCGFRRIAHVRLSTPPVLALRRGCGRRRREPGACGRRASAAGRGGGPRTVAGVWRAETAGASPWVCHAEGTLSTGSVAPAADLSVWPPAGAVAVDATDGYERLAAKGYGYGPAFRGLTAMWVRGDE